MPIKLTLTVQLVTVAFPSVIELHYLALVKLSIKDLWALKCIEGLSGLTRYINARFSRFACVHIKCWSSEI